MSGRDFVLDPFQLEAIAAIDAGHSVLVAAPTGAGKTVVADAAVDLALSSGGRAFYTTPVKALSNQKYADLVARLGPGKVGLLTGDLSIRGDAPVVVMTTEVLRNMLYAASAALDDLHVVVLDEVHYLQDAYRGPVWEEVILGLAPNVALVCLSATVSNIDELGEWISDARGVPVSVVVETERPVELHPLYLVGDRLAETDHLVPVLVDDAPNEAGFRFDTDPRAVRAGRAGPRRRFRTPRRVEVVERLAAEELLPAIYFIFSRDGCEDALALVRDSGMRFTGPDERRAVRAVVEEAVAGLHDGDLDALGYDLWLEALESGIAAHHAGMVPAFKEAVERCFVRGLVKVVFATETLALGVNMPARSVVIEKLTKYNGESHEFLTPAQFTQLTGRAGRRGIDEVGHAVVLWSPFVGFGQVAALASSTQFPLTSSFRPTYNMAVNLVRRYERPAALELLGSSFAQFQADRALGDLHRRLATDERRRTGLVAESTCERGDVAEYLELHERVRSERRNRPDGRAAVERSLSLLRPGDVISPDGDQRLVVISVATRGKGSVRVRAVDRRGELVRLDATEAPSPLRSFATVELPVPYAPADPRFRDGVAAALRACPVRPPVAAPAGTSRWERLAARLEAHPVAACPDARRHLDAARTLTSLDREIASLRRNLERRSGSVVRRFEALVDLLGALGFLDGWSLTPAGERLARIYHESDLLVALALDDGVLDGLSPPALAAVAAALTFEERRPDSAPAARPASREARRRLARLERLWGRLNRAERERGLPLTRPPAAGFMALAEGWAAGAELGPLIEDEISGGDFVRNVRLLVDLLRQVAEVAPELGTRSAAAAAADALHRGVVGAVPGSVAAAESTDPDAGREAP